MAAYVSVPYNDYNKLMKDSVDKANVIKIIETEFPDADCQLIAIKSILDIKEESSDDTTTE